MTFLLIDVGSIRITSYNVCYTKLLRVFAKLDGFFGEDEVLAAEPEKMVEAPVEALAGVDVETEADDESDEAPLPVWDSGDVAPALSGFDDVEDELVIEADLEAGVEKSS